MGIEITRLKILKDFKQDCLAKGKLLRLIYWHDEICILFYCNKCTLCNGALNKKEKRISFRGRVFAKKTSYEFKLIFKKGWKTQNRVLEIYSVIHTHKITMTP